jgi:hypothetical protein
MEARLLAVIGTAESAVLAGYYVWQCMGDDQAPALSRKGVVI